LAVNIYINFFNYVYLYLYEVRNYFNFSINWIPFHGREGTYSMLKNIEIYTVEFKVERLQTRTHQDSKMNGQTDNIMFPDHYLFLIFQQTKHSQPSNHHSTVTINKHLYLYIFQILFYFNFILSLLIECTLLTATRVTNGIYWQKLNKNIFYK
jgi:hypothetical protein